MSEGSHPFPSRTRKLSPPEPMVLRGKPRGRVGRCRIFFDESPSKTPHGLFEGLLLLAPFVALPATVRRTLQLSNFTGERPAGRFDWLMWVWLESVVGSAQKPLR